MNTENTEDVGRQGSVFYDAQCPFCRAARKRWGRFFALRGYEWVPLQMPGVAQRLGLSQSALLNEMKLQLPDGRIIGGIDSWTVLFRSVWWLWPAGFLLSLPGFHAFGQGCYRWIARNRYCLSGKCTVATKRRHRRTIPFFDLP